MRYLTATARRNLAVLLTHNTAALLTTTLRFDIDTFVISTYYSLHITNINIC
ncbi:hypothetical protein AOLE_13065 [Acinetobacter oleivorans DR1]|uniref:Uncharacterized protein n=1 Tax=Acinetobacter oleivorans (strain JCM 16667 / KCTC 23045 / DR1) TaxID=436717 RepID=A0AAN0UDW2_ACISD|nr:hypothetical protein AOLE_13065 [Acinetobacter oleivorans DR1]